MKDNVQQCVVVTYKDKDKIRCIRKPEICARYLNMKKTIFQRIFEENDCKKFYENIVIKYQCIVFFVQTTCFCSVTFYSLMSVEVSLHETGCMN